MTDEAPARVMPFAAPTWLRDLGFTSWLPVGFVLIVVGVVWLLDQTSTIVMPVIVAATLGAVAGPAVGRLERHRVPRAGGAILVLLDQALERIRAWFDDLGVDDTRRSRRTCRRRRPRSARRC